MRSACSRRPYCRSIASGKRSLRATIARDARPNDAWNYGVIGDAHLELGEYDEAFDAFDRMIQLRPSAAAYARASYARELQGDLKAAVRFMQMAREATPPTDPESQAWHDVQLAHLDMELDRLDDADHHLDRAMFRLCQLRAATEMRVRLLTMQRRFEEAAQMASVQLARVPTPALAVQAGDAMSALGRTADADRYYRQAEELWRYEPAALARFLADSGRDVTRAVKLARARPPRGATSSRRTRSRGRCSKPGRLRRPTSCYSRRCAPARATARFARTPPKFSGRCTPDPEANQNESAATPSESRPFSVGLNF
jgi:tetratricopeptide (TPR) repeat protein